jgi:2-dehydropantoate 2-reductase
MKIAVVGAGSMGCIYATFMAEAGHEVWTVDTWQDHIDAMRANGLRLEGASGDRTVAVQATTDATEVGTCDLVIIATKAMHVEQAAKSALALAGDDTDIVTIQNGLGSADKVAALIDRGRLAIGVAEGFGASMKGPGHAHHNGMKLIRLGNRNAKVNAELEKVAMVWADAGFNVKTFDDIDQLIWEKLICNVCYSGTSTITEWTIAEILGDEDAWRVASGCAAEAYAVAKARGIHLDYDDPVAHVHEFGSKLGAAQTSMLLDVLNGRRCEIDAINGAIPPAGAEVGVPTPYNEVVTSIIRAKEVRLGLR